MCGLTGYSAPARQPIDVAALKLLILYARDRGTDSTGMMIDGKLRKYWSGTYNDKNGDAHVVLQNVRLPNKSEYTEPNVLVHCRSKSVGAVTEGNTHPFEYLNNVGDIIYFTHNGTIKNIDELAKKYEVTVQTGETDSQTFGEILLASDFQALLEYTGTAAFSMYNTNTKEFYLWKGFSNHDNSAKASVERPLFYYHKGTKLYYHSTGEALSVALNTPYDIYELPDNTLTIVRNGKIVSEIEYDRSAVVTKYTSTTTYRVPHTSRVVSNASKYIPETTPQNKAGKKVYFWKGRYYMGGHIINGKKYLNNDGLVVAENVGTEYHFWNGLMFANEASLHAFMEHIVRLNLQGQKFDAVENACPVHTLSGFLHRDTIYYRYAVSYGYTIYKNGNWVGKMWLKPIFGYYEYMLDADFNIVTRVIGAAELVFPTHQQPVVQGYPANWDPMEGLYG